MNIEFLEDSKTMIISGLSLNEVHIDSNWKKEKQQNIFTKYFFNLIHIHI